MFQLVLDKAPRKIILPISYNPYTGHSEGADPKCDHDYPDNTKKVHDEYCVWTCTRC